MASARTHIRIARSPDEVWKVVSDAGALAAWAPNIVESTVSGNRRHVEFAEGFSLEEEIVTSDDELRRFQYRGVDNPFPSEFLATVDVIEDADGALVIYGTEISWADDPNAEREIAKWTTTNSAGFLQGLKDYLEA